MSEAMEYVVPEGTTEQDIVQKNDLIATEAKSLSISNDEEYEQAADFAKTIAARKKIVTDYFAPMKKAAHDAHKQVCDRENQLLEPLKSAERMCKGAMTQYMMKKQEEARRREAEIKRLAEEEAKRQLEEAQKLEAAGKKEEADSALSQAVVAEQLGTTAFVNGDAPKVKGVSHSKDWEIVSIDDSKVPIAISGAVIRPVDQAAIKRLIKATDGKIMIPGVEFRETLNLSISSRR